MERRFTSWMRHAHFHPQHGHTNKYNARIYGDSWNEPINKYNFDLHYNRYTNDPTNHDKHHNYNNNQNAGVDPSAYHNNIWNASVDQSADS